MREQLPIIAPVDRSLLKAELTPERQLRLTNKSHNDIYIVDYHCAPNVMNEIGRQREEAFRAAGGGTGKAADIDEFDTMPNCYKQLIVWNPEEEEIIGGYRYKLGSEVEFDENGQPKLATSHMFHFSQQFIDNYLPHTIELARSYVAVKYQNTRLGAKSLFALDNLWDGLGALSVVMKDVRYFFGKVTMYPSYVRRGRDMILFFLKKYFHDPDHLIIPKHPLSIEEDAVTLAAFFNGHNFKEDYRKLNSEIRRMGYNIPPLVNAYMNLSPTMRMFGTAVNDGFGDVEETGILIAMDEIFEEKRIRHIQSFVAQHPELIQLTSGANKVIYPDTNRQEV
ncbi:MAG: GNAT family N-acetyltransferase [Bacteroidaceae bacterium]|nr:GNAT family N-acetyltransferase [Bacteroidaceae bacterium]